MLIRRKEEIPILSSSLECEITNDKCILDTGTSTLVKHRQTSSQTDRWIYTQEVSLA